MIEKTVIKEIKRLVRLSYQTYRLFGIRFLIKEVIRYLRYGAIPVYNSNLNEQDEEDYLSHYTNEQIFDLLHHLKHKPLLSIITPVYNVCPEYLDKCIESVLSQFYENWELCLYDDYSTKEETRKCLEKWSVTDHRIKVKFGSQNLHISLASNEAIKMSTGTYIGFLDHDDELLQYTLLEIVNVINKNPEVDFIYTDEDNISPKGDYFNPHFKSDFNKALILSHNYITHFVIVKRELGDRIRWFRAGYEGSQDHDLILRMMEITTNIIHIPKILYHWRQTGSSTSLNYREKNYAANATRKALSDYACRNGFNAEILDGPGLGVFRLKRELITNEMVSIIIPFKDQVGLLNDCVTSILEKTSYRNFEVLLISNNSEDAKTFEFLEHIKDVDQRIRVMEHNIPFNFSEINNWGVQHARGNYILLLNNDIKVINDDWLEAMLEHIQQDNVGAVGAKLLYSDNTVQHAGVIIGILGVAGHSHKFFSDKSVGYFYRAAVTQNLSAVTGACLLTKKEVWKKIGGLDEKKFKIAFNDIDFCLKIRSLGYDIVYTPYAKLYHYESKSRGPEDTPEKQKRFAEECQLMIERWGTNRIPDPYYNVNLTLSSENFSLKK
jgi:O-antigen biosynthesis protein